MSRIASIDFGFKRIGIALSDERKKMAFPYLTIAGGRHGVANTARALRSKGEIIEKIIVGLPLLMNGQKGEMAIAVELFANELEKEMDIPVSFCDERLSSKMAEQFLMELPLNRKERSTRLDTMSAVLLLQTYLDQSAF